jgi:hypothetical protein
MTKYYSASTNGFYFEEMNGDAIPEDSVEITDEQWGALLDGRSQGKLITSDKKGRPILQDYPAPTSKQLIEMAEAEKQNFSPSPQWLSILCRMQRTWRLQRTKRR